MRADRSYPFVAKSTMHLRPGHFWDIPLDNGGYACGRVLFTPSTPGVSERFQASPLRNFTGGVLDWSGDRPPAADNIAGRPLVDYGQMHIVALRDAGSQIRGLRDLADDGLVGLRFTDSSFGGGMYEDGRYIEEAPGRHEHIKTITTWGRAVMKNLAEARFG